jgi:hypothetical protein
MSVYLVTYEFQTSRGNHRPVHEYLGRFEACKRSDNIWLVDTDREASQIRRDLIALLDTRDAVFVAQIQPHWAAYNFGPTDWLRAPERTW